MLPTPTPNMKPVKLNIGARLRQFIYNRDRPLNVI